VGVTTDRLLQLVSDLAEADLGDFLTISKGAWKIDVAKAKKSGRTHIIRKLKEGKHGTELELHDKLKALELVGRYLGLWNRRERALRRKYLEVLQRKAEGGPSEFCLADLVAEAEKRAEARKRERNQSDTSEGRNGT